MRRQPLQRVSGTGRDPDDALIHHSNFFGRAKNLSVYERGMMWSHVLTVEPDANGKQHMHDVWTAEEGDAMALIASKPHGFELTAWWTGKKGQLTDPKRPPCFPTLEAAQAEAHRLVYARTADWSRLLED